MGIAKERTMAIVTMLDKVLRYLEAGIPVFPCHINSKKPLTKTGFKEATIDEDQIREWWDHTPNANIGMPMGEVTDLICIDIDNLKNGKPNLWPHCHIKEEEMSCGVLVMTPSGGRHYIYRKPDLKHYKSSVGTETSGLANRVDIRAWGSYIIAAGSNGYKEIMNSLLDDEISLPPQWLIDDLDALHLNDLKKDITGSLSPEGEASLIEEGSRNHALASYGGSMRRIGMTIEEILAGLKVINDNRCKPPMTNQEVLRIAQSIGRYNPHSDTVEVIENPVKDPFDLVAHPIPENLMTIPGFVGEYIDYMNSVSVYKNHSMAFAGSLAMMSHLTARKVMDDNETATNLYILGLAESGSGKDKPRKVNKKLCERLSISHELSDTFATAEGFEDAMIDRGKMFYQVDEMDSMIEAMSGKRYDPRQDKLKTTLLSIYTSSDSSISRRHLAKSSDKDKPDAPIITPQVMRPHLTMFGTAIPSQVYGSLSESMLRGGFFGRLLIIENSSDRIYNEAVGLVSHDLPPRVLTTAHKWTEFNKELSNNPAIDPEPSIVSYTPEAADLCIEYRKFIDDFWRICKGEEDSIGTSVWARVYEMRRKLQMIYACSVDMNHLVVTSQAVEWAHQITLIGAKRMLFQARTNIYKTPYEALTKRIIAHLKKQKGKTIKRRELLRKFGDQIATDMDNVLDSMVQSGQVLRDERKTNNKGRGMVFITLVEGVH